LRRATIVPVALIVFSLSGVATTFRGQGIAIVAWALSVAVAAWLAAAAGAWRGIAWLPQQQRLLVPGSWWPMALILSLFITKFAVGITLAMQPSLARDALFA